MPNEALNPKATFLICEGLSMRVCFVSHDASMAGAERALLELVQALKAKHVETLVVLPRRGPLLDALARQKVPFVIIRYFYWAGKAALWKGLGGIVLSAVAAIPVMFWFRRWKVSLVCTNSLVVFTGALAALISRKPHVWFIHELADKQHYMRPFLPRRLSMRFVNYSSALILTPSNTTKEYYARYIPRSKIQVAYQAVIVDMSQDRPRPNLISTAKTDMLKCVSMGALSPGKGHSDAIRAVGILRRRGVAVQLTIVGSGPDRLILENLAATEHVNDRVSFTGFLDDPVPALKDADIVVVCSRNEGFGRVVVEAMRLGKPVVAAASGATLELVQDGRTGLLYEPGNAEQLAERILSLRFQSSRTALGKRGRDWAKRFSLERYGSTVLKAFNRVMLKYEDRN